MALIEQLTDAYNFGQWIDKINEIIDSLNIASDISTSVEEIISDAVKNGQIGTILNQAPKNSYNDYTENGVYYVPDSVNSRPEDSGSMLYVSTNGESIAQYAITISSEPKLYIRSRTDTSSQFSAWYYIPSKDVNDKTYLKQSGGSIAGDIEFKGNSVFKTISVNENANFYGTINIENSGSSLFVENDKQNVTFNSKKDIPVSYYIQEDGSVSTDKAGKDIAYYIFDNKLITYTTVYYIQKNLKTITSDENGDNVVYYIQDDGRITLQKTGEDTRYYLSGNTILGTDKETPVFIIIDNKVYTYSVQFYIKDDIIYTDKELQSIKYYIEDNKVLSYNVFGYFIRDPEFPLANPVKVTSDAEGNNILYYIHDNRLTTDEEGLNTVFYRVEDTISTDEEGINVIYYVLNDTMCQKETMYYIVENSLSTDESGENKVFYMLNDLIVSLVELKFFIHEAVDTISSDTDGIHTVYYIQKNNTITTDKEGNNVVLYLQSEAVTDDISGNNIVYYIIDGTLRVHNVEYYIQEDDTITIDREGLIIQYKRYGNQILQETSPIIINLDKNTADINGTSQNAFYLKSTGLTDSYTGNGLNLAASGNAVFGLYNFVLERYIPESGGSFSGIVHFKNDILLGKDSENRPVKIYSYDDLYFQCLKTVSFVANNDWCELYIDKQNEPRNKDIPCIFGARTRTGTTENNIGTPVYALGSIEFTEDQTTIRVRKKNLTQVTTEEDKIDVALTLERKDNEVSLFPSLDRTVSLGTGALRFNQIYSASGEISTSDRNMKSNISSIDEDLLEKWKNIEWKSFKFKDSVSKKGEKARIHTGLIAQDVSEALNGVDIQKYGFYCSDTWDDIFDTQYLTIPEKTDIEGKVISRKENKKVTKKVKDAGEQLSLRYQEVQAIENAFLRNEIRKLKEEILELKNSLKKDN